MSGPLWRIGLRASLPATLITAAIFVLYASLFAHFRITSPGHADGFYSYLYARSIAFDKDIDFRNDYELCGDPWGVGIDRGTGHPDNQAYAGPAVFWAPIVWVAKRTVSLPADAPASARNGCDGPIAAAALSTSVPLGALAIGLSYLVARRFASGAIASFVALLFAVASSLPEYVVLSAEFSHVYECFACALLVWLAVRASESTRIIAWAPVGLAAALCTLQRLSDACFVLVPLALLVAAPRPTRFKLVATAMSLVGVALGASATLSIYRYLYGSPFVLPQGRHFIHLAHAHPLLLLFAPHGGLFYATPIAYLGVLGLLVALFERKTRALAVGSGLAFLVCLWVSSSALDWHGKGTFGARRLIVAIPVFVVFSAIALARFERFLRRHRTVLVAVAALAIFGVPVIGASFAIARGDLGIEGGSSQAIEYGNGVRAFWSFLDESVGDVAIYPAEVLYSMRFGLPMRSFRAATADKFYRRSYRTLAWEPQTIDFSDATLHDASSGLSFGASGALVTGRQATVVFAAQWPFATDAVLDVDAMEGGRLDLTIGTFFHRCHLEGRDVPSGEVHGIHWTIPPGCFDSGLIELAFRVSSPGRIALRALKIDDATAYPPPYSEH